MKANCYIVTGATGGIGRAITEALMRRQVGEVVMACRNVWRAEELASELKSTITSDTRLTVMKLDLNSMEDVDDFVDQFTSSGRKIAALFNNAGTMPGEVSTTVDGYESATQTNCLATIRLTRQLLEYIEDGGAIVFTTSMTRRIVRLRSDWERYAIECKHPLRRFTVYGRSKLMLTHYAMYLSEELRSRNIRVNCSDPGIVDSAIISMDNKIIDRLSELLFRPLINTPAEGAEPALHALDTAATGQIFTRRHHRPIPHSYANSPLHHQIISEIKSI